jgi:hypothetical protein
MQVPIGGAYRLIDVPMSNCINSGINKIYILTQYNSASLNRHLAHTYNFGNGVNFGNGYVEVTHVHTCFKTSKLRTHMIKHEGQSDGYEGWFLHLNGAALSFFNDFLLLGLYMSFLFLQLCVNRSCQPHRDLG